MEEFEQPSDTEPAPLPTHAGPLPAPDDDFFVPLPAEIGEPLSVQTNWSQGKPYPSFARRATLPLIIVVVATGMGLSTALHGDFSSVVTGVSFALFGLMVAWFFYRRAKVPTATYVGTLGWSRHRMDRMAAGQMSSKIFRFAEANAVHVNEIDVEVNSRHVATHVSFMWVDEVKKPLGTIRGTRRENNRETKLTSDYWFGRAAERAWSEHWLARQLDALNTIGHIDFPSHSDMPFVKKENHRLGLGWAEYHSGKKSHRYELTDVQLIQSNSGKVLIHFHDKDFLGTGKLAIQPQEIPNFLAFRLALERVFGYRQDS